MIQSRHMQGNCHIWLYVIVTVIVCIPKARGFGLDTVTTVKSGASNGRRIAMEHVQSFAHYTDVV